MLVWGISALTHDASISVINDKDILFAGHAERYSKIKNDPHLNKQLIRDALQYGQPESVVWFENRWLKKWRQFRHFQWQYLFNINRWPNRYLRQFGIRQEVVSVNHHLSHASAGFFTSPFEEACILCIDALGESQTITVWKGCSNEITLFDEIHYPHSLGMLYTAFTQRCGLKPNEEEYILMGMSAFGKPIYVKSIFKDFVAKKDFALKQNIHKGIGKWMPDAKLEDLAASIQKVFEICLNSILHKYSFISDNIVYMGGSALNCVANKILYDHFKKVWIMPNPGDAGSSLGCAAFHQKQKLNWTTPYLGHEICRPYPIESLLSELIKGNIVGVANGKAEFGPRALGNRSLFCDPRCRNGKIRVNQIKKRQKFRPFAASIREEDVAKYFDLSKIGMSNPKYMQYTVPCFDPKSFPSIVHVDGTSRIQVVSHKDHPEFHKLLTQYQNQTDCPMLLNTSLNIKGQPLVNDAEDAKRFQLTYDIKVF